MTGHTAACRLRQGGVSAGRDGAANDRAGSGTSELPARAALPLAIVLILASCLLLPGAVAADITAALGDTVHLSGYSYGSSTVYLFLTGPNLPVNGVSLDDLVTPAGAGGLTRVNADDQHQWKYDWDTTSGRTLDPDTYTVWITTEPVDRSGIRSGNYRTFSVALRTPGLAIAARQQPGSVSFRSSPSGASVVFNGQSRGKTPLTIGDITPGTYEALLSCPGCRPLAVTVTVGPGAMAEVNATLVPYTGSVAVTTSPAGARILLDGSPAGNSPVTREGIPAGSHTVTALLDGYVTAEQPVLVPADGTATVTLTLSPSGGGTSPSPTRAGSPGTAVIASCMVILVIPALRHRNG